MPARVAVTIRHRSLLAAVLAAVAALVLSVLTAPVAEARPPAGRFAIGDSVMLGAVSQLQRKGFRVDASVSRSFTAARSIMQGQGSRLPRNVVIHLGANSYISKSECRAIVRTAGKKRRVFFVNVQLPNYSRYAYESSNNQALAQCDRSFPKKRVRVINWNKFSDRNRWVLCSDGYHISCGGQNRYARLVDRAVDKFGYRR